jgi:nicotinate-nucleotide--dimethylbenzimidazole phosphoribosyltransferase
VSLLESTIGSILAADEATRAKAKARLDQLAMPHWALGRLMDLAMDLAGMTRSLAPPVARKAVVVFAADHGVVAEGVSKYPQAVTAQMVLTFVRGGAGINALARLSGARVVVVDMGVAGDLSALAEAGRIVSKRIGPGARIGLAGTRNMARGPAMSRAEARRALEAGIEIARDLGDTVDVFGTGDMGIGNTTASAAIAAAITGRAVAEVTGRGTGIDDEQLRHKVAVIQRALNVNRPDAKDGLDVLAKVGGFEIGGLAGLILGAAAQRKPVVLDGFISTAGALVAYALAPAVADYLVAGHRSEEKGHDVMLEHLGKKPLLDLGLRLGEGTGAALAMNLMDAAVRILTEVATFAEASVSQAQR